LAKTCPSEDHALHAWLLVWFTGRVVTGDVHASSLATRMTGEGDRRVRQHCRQCGRMRAHCDGGETMVT